MPDVEADPLGIFTAVDPNELQKTKGKVRLVRSK